jgi:capsular polysaccharide biosynthesis protein
MSQGNGHDKLTATHEPRINSSTPNEAFERQEALLGRQAELLERQAGLLDRQATPAPPPPRVDAIGASWRYPLLVLIPALILGGVGAVLSHRKPPTYTAQAKVLVGAPAPGTSGELPGVVQAEQSLASIYAREITFNPVVAPLAGRFQQTPGNIAARLSATPLPDAPIINVIATGKTSGQAVDLANAAGAKLASFVTSQTQSVKPANRAFGSYQQAATTLAQARAHENHVAQNHQSDPNNPAVVRAQSQVQVAQLMLNIQGTQYQNLLDTRHNTPTLTMFQSATSATDNRKSSLELYVVGGVIAGLVIGAALATLLANRKAIKASRRAAAVA